MATVKLIEYGRASAEVRAVYDDIMATRKTDWINNFWKALASHPPTLRQRLDGWAVFVEPVDADAALDALAAYDRENAPEREVEVAASRPFTIVGLVVALLLIGFFAVTGPRGERSAWFERGSADAARMVAGEWWRAGTALTVHRGGV